MLNAFLLGILQGLTEFFPVSSSTHIKLAKILFGLDVEGGVLFDLTCHFGTLCALLIFLRKEIFSLFLCDRKKLFLLFVALLPLIPAYFLLKPLREYALREQHLGLCLMITALILFLAQRWQLKREESPLFKRQIKDVLCIGTMQSAALIPGISRSASTISMAKILGWRAKEAVRFSFLLSIPTILGGNCLELLRLHLTSEHSVSFSSCLIGFLSSLGVGVLVIPFAMRWLEKGNLTPFAIYCFILGCIAFSYLNFFYE
jgi:undecaprenyl-diphosphatase